MDIIAPIPPHIYNIKAINPVKSVDGAVQHNLLPQQFLQATVVTGGTGDVVLNFAGENVAAQTEQPLLSGQKLNLQVLSTDPQLKLQIVADNADPVLLRLVHVFDHPSELGNKLNQLLQQRALLLAPTANTPMPSSTTTSTLAAPTSLTAPANSTMTTLPITAPSVVPSNGSASTPAVAATIQIIASGAGSTSAPAGATTTSQPAVTNPSNLMVNNAVNVATAAVATPEAGQAAPVAPAANTPRVLATACNDTSNPTVVPTSVKGEGKISATVSAVGAKLAPLPAGAVLTAAALDTTKQPLAAALSAPQWQQLQQLATGLTSAMNSPNEKLVVNMARMLGLDFEFLSAQQQTAQSNVGLKGMMSALRENGNIVGAVREQAASMTHQLEALQLCRLRLAQEGVLFLPLPFEFLEQGYVLFEQQSQQESADGKESSVDSYLVSVNLSMVELGPIQANLLFEQQQLFVRILCADDASVAIVRQHIDELRQGLQEFHLGSVQVTTGAKDPALELLRRLQTLQQAEDDTSLFDARV